MPTYATDLPTLGEKVKDIVREQRAVKPKMQLKARASKGTRPLEKLTAAERRLTRASGSKAIARVLGTKLGARLLPALAIAMTAREVGQAAKEGIEAGVAYRDLERTRAYIQKKYGNPKKAAETRHKIRR